MTANGVDKKKRVRSPAYPAFGLEDCIERAKAIYQAEDRHFAALEAVASYWEYKTNNSSFMQYLSSLKQFGLLQEEGSGDARKFRLTERALDILTYEAANQKWKQAVKEAALEPKIHRELWDKYGGKLPREDGSIRVYLIRERQEGLFNKDHVDGFIAQFRSTIAFAGLSENDKIEAGGAPEQPSDEPPPNGSEVAEKPKARRKVASGSKEDVYTLSSGDAVLQWPERITQEEFDELGDWLDLMRRKLKRSVVSGSAEDDREPDA